MDKEDNNTHPYITGRSERRSKRRQQFFSFISTVFQAFSIGCTMIYYGFYCVPSFWNVYHIFWFLLTFCSFGCWASSRIQLGALATFRPKVGKYIVTSGLYKYFRHPIYYFGTIALFSYIMLLKRYQLLFVFVIIIPMQIIRALREEKVLKGKFEEHYEDYKRSLLL